MKVPKLDARTSKIILLITAGVLALVAFALFVIPALKSSAEVSTKNAGAQLDRTKADEARLAAEKAAREALEKEIQDAKNKFENEVHRRALEIKNEELDWCAKNRPPEALAWMLLASDNTKEDCMKQVDAHNNAGLFFIRAFNETKSKKPNLIPDGWDVEAFSNKTFNWYEDALG